MVMLKCSACVKSSKSAQVNSRISLHITNDNSQHLAVGMQYNSTALLLLIVSRCTRRLCAHLMRFCRMVRGTSCSRGCTDTIKSGL